MHSDINGDDAKNSRCEEQPSQDLGDNILTGKLQKLRNPETCTVKALSSAGRLPKSKSRKALAKDTRIRYALNGIRGGNLGCAERRTVIQDEILRSMERPGPQSYTVRAEDSTPDHGGKMLGSFDGPPANNTLHWTWRVERLRREGSPSPDKYCKDLAEPLRLSGGRWSSSRFERDKWLTSSVESPGPAAYDSASHNPPRATGCLISRAKCKSQLDWHLLSAAKSPGPGEYIVPAPSLTKPLSFGSCRKDICDPVPKVLAPGPGSYDLARGPSSKGIRIGPPSAKGRGPGIFNVSYAPGPGAYDTDQHTIAHRVLPPEPLHIARPLAGKGSRMPGTLDPVIYGKGRPGPGGRWSLSGDWRTLESLAQGWLASSRAVDMCLSTLKLSGSNLSRSDITSES